MSVESKSKNTNNHTKDLEKITSLEKELEKTKMDAAKMKKELEETKKELKLANEKCEKANEMLISTLESQKEFLKQSNRSSILAIDKAVDAMAYIATHQKKESKVRQIKYGNA
jgi:hypothetical protein